MYINGFINCVVNITSIAVCSLVKTCGVKKFLYFKKYNFCSEEGGGQIFKVIKTRKLNTVNKLIPVIAKLMLNSMYLLVFAYFTLKQHLRGFGHVFVYC